MTLHHRLWDEPKNTVACLCGWSEPASAPDDAWEKLRAHFVSVGYVFSGM